MPKLFPMKHETSAYEQFVVYALALAVALALTFFPVTARSGSYTTHEVAPAGPRWSNDHHHEYGLIVRPGCVALPPGAGAEYIPGRDAWGRPVIPAEPLQGFRPSFPMGVDLDVNLGTKHVGGKDIELHGGHLAFDPATNDLTLNGHHWTRDCIPSPK